MWKKIELNNNKIRQQKIYSRKNIYESYITPEENKEEYWMKHLKNMKWIETQERKKNTKRVRSALMYLWKGKKQNNRKRFQIDAERFLWNAKKRGNLKEYNWRNW